MSGKTAGKEPGVTFHVDSGTGAVRVSPRPSKGQAVLGLLNSGGQAVQVRLSSTELRLLARALLKVAGALEDEAFGEELTQS